MSYLGTSINNSPTIVSKRATTAANDPADYSCLAAALTPTGEITLGSDASAIGVCIPETGTIAVGDDITVQIKDIGLWKTGAAVAAGANLMSNADGKAVTATTGKFILAVALEAATAADQVIRVQICKAGFQS